MIRIRVLRLRNIKIYKENLPLFGFHETRRDKFLYFRVDHIWFINKEKHLKVVSHHDIILKIIVIQNIRNRTSFFLKLYSD